MRRVDSLEKTLMLGGIGGRRRWDGWMASLTRWTWVWANSGSWWWTGRPGVLRFMGLQRVRHDWVTELNWCIDSVHLLGQFLQLFFFKVLKTTHLSSDTSSNLVFCLALLFSELLVFHMRKVDQKVYPKKGGRVEIQILTQLLISVTFLLLFH